VRSFAFSVAYWALNIFYGVLALLAAALPGRRPTTWVIGRYVRRMVWCMRVLAGIRLEVRGARHRPEGAFIIAAKHQSWGDGFCMYSQFEDLAFVIGAHMEKYPGVGLILRKLGVIIVDNAGGSSARRALMAHASQVQSRGGAS
jgi:1-acyl-sn-glycerol-3-phosphate acyltransferase